MTFTGSRYIYTGDFTLMLSVGEQRGSGVAAGSSSGTYVVADGILNYELASSDLNILITVDTPVSCDEPTLMFQSGETGATCHLVVLTPA
jgi:hypothetical protein